MRTSFPVVGVTGAGGMVGRVLVESLKTLGHDVKPLKRAPSGEVIGRLNANQSIGCVSGGWIGDFSDIDIVIHCGAVTIERRNHINGKGLSSSSFSDNPLGTADLIEILKNTRIRRLIYVSSTKVDPLELEIRQRENQGANFSSASDPGKSYAIKDLRAYSEIGYAESKFLSEQLVIAYAKELGIETAIVRSPIVYGPGIKGNFFRLLNLVFHGVPLPVKGLGGKVPIVSLANLTDFLIYLTNAPRFEPGVYYPKDQKELTLETLVTEIKRIMFNLLKDPRRKGQRPFLFPLTKKLPATFKPPFFVTRALFTIFRRYGDYNQFRGVLGDYSCSSARTTDWTASPNQEQALVTVIDWFLIKHAGKKFPRV
jgi:nucleoside-diphosphate-sugar epimerase